MKLQSGNVAKSFQVTDIFEQPIDLDNYRGKPLLLSFYRYAACPLCNLRIHQLVQQYDGFAAQGLQTLAFFQSPAAKILEYVTGKNDVPFPLIADPEHTLYRLYGVEQASVVGYIRGVFSKRMWAAHKMDYIINDPEGIQTLHPADFLIDQDFKIHTAFYGTDIGEHIPLSQIEMFLAFQQKIAA
ncbi:MAG: peroxiredoxin-like family protein [Chloroflexota bacterium]